MISSWSRFSSVVDTRTESANSGNYFVFQNFSILMGLLYDKFNWYGVLISSWSHFSSTDDTRTKSMIWTMILHFGISAFLMGLFHCKVDQVHWCHKHCLLKYFNKKNYQWYPVEAASILLLTQKLKVWFRQWFCVSELLFLMDLFHCKVDKVHWCYKHCLF